jgi:hypothetical protein
MICFEKEKLLDILADVAKLGVDIYLTGVPIENIREMIKQMFPFVENQIYEKWVNEA